MHSAYSLQRDEPIEEIQARLLQVKHKKSGARVLHIACDDPENLFCLAFRTLPESSDGVAHILEHTVLCGSKKYPVKDPFFSMTRRSLNTFMNAMTGSDITFYPAASQVEQDFYNLLEVYLDAVFYPNLDELSFKQEGHRLEFEEPDDESSPLVHKGIVFNEMKGALASPDARAWKRLSKRLYPNTTYGYESGGDPKEIPSLTYEELKKFHKDYYHPSRCLFFFYGNLPLEEHLAFIHDKVLTEVTPLPKLPSVPSQPRFTEPTSDTLRYPIAPTEEIKDRFMVWLGWLTCLTTEPLEVLALGVLDIVLMGSDAAPLKRSLLESGLCKQAFSLSDPDILDVPFCIAARGCCEGKAEEIETFIMASLKEIAFNKEAQTLVEGAIHQLEFERLEIGGEGSPFGLTLFDRTAPLLLHGGDPKDGLILHSLFKKLRKRFSNPAYLSKLIQQTLIDNPHRCRLEMLPDPDLAAEEQSMEEKILADIKNKLNGKEKDHLIQSAKDLEAFQEKQEGANLEVLPKITLDKVSKEAVDYPLTVDPCGNLEVFHHNCFTNEILYAQLHYDLPPLSEEELPYLRLLTRMLTEVGCGNRSYEENLAYIQAHTGGIGAGLALNIEVSSLDAMHPQISIGGKALCRKGDKFFPLLKETVESAHLTDRKRLKELLIQHASSLESSIIRHAMSYATTLAASGLSLAGAMQQRWYGTDYLHFIRSLVEEGNMDALIEKFAWLKERLFCGRPHLIVGCGEAALSELFNKGFYGLDGIAIKEGPAWSSSERPSSVSSQGKLIASGVAFTCRVIPSVPYTHPDAPALLCLSKLLGNQTLHQEIREKGGAYGAGARYNPSLGSFHFYTYRDPNFLESLEAMDLAINRVATGQIDQRHAEEALLSVLQKADSPVSPEGRAPTSYGRFRTGKHKEVRQAFRDRLLTLTSKDLTAACMKHLLPKMKGSLVISFAGKELLESSGLPVFPV